MTTHKLDEDADDGTKRHYHSHALSRGLRILRVVATSSQPATIAHLHTATGFPKSTLVRLISVLEADDWLLRVDERPAYRLGHGMLPLATGYLETASVADILRPHLAALAEVTGWTANFGVLEGSEVVHLCVEFPNRPIRYSTTEGSSHPAYCTGLGKAILSQVDDEEVIARALPSEPFPQLTPHTITTHAQMRENLRMSAERGYAIDEEEADLGLRCLAVSVTTAPGVLGALSIAGPSGEAGAEREQVLVAELLRTRDHVDGVHTFPPGLEQRHR